MSSRRGSCDCSQVKGNCWLVLLAMMGIVALWLRPIALRGAVTETEIYQGVWYRCERVAAGEGGAGLIHIVRVDLAAPGVGLYVTPMDKEAVKRGAQYRLALPQSVLKRNELAVVVNGTLFEVLGKIPLPGACASSNETLVSAGIVSHIHQHSYLLWFDRSLAPKLETSKPPSADVLSRAWWAIGGQGTIHVRAKSVPSGDSKRDRQTAIGVAPARRMLWLMVFEDASSDFAGRAILNAGATDAILVDSGDSGSMVLGADAIDIDGGAAIGGYRPIPTCFGIYAKPLPYQD